jgi:RNA polymerase sigma-70 factor, ECF subfamily
MSRNATILAWRVFQGTMIDEHALPRALARDLDRHFEDLVVCFQDRLYGFALRLLGSSRDAEESTQDAFVRAYRALQGYAPERRQELHLRAWLFQIVLNVVRNRVRRAHLAETAIDDELEAVLPSHTADEQPEAQALHAERLRDLAKALGDLPQRYGAAVTLRHVHGLSYEEAAEVLGQPVGTTKSDVHRGLRMLRDTVEGEHADARRPARVG